MHVCSTQGHGERYDSTSSRILGRFVQKMEKIDLEDTAKNE